MAIAREILLDRPYGIAETENLKTYQAGCVFAAVRQFLAHHSWRPSVLVLDSDFSMRPNFGQFFSGKPGGVPQESINMIDGLLSRDHQVLIATDQPTHGHQVARLMSELFNYSAFPFVFRQRQIEIVGSGGIFFPGYYKRTADAAERVFEHINNLTQTKRIPIACIGDSGSDRRLAINLSDMFAQEGQRYQVSFYQLSKRFWSWQESDLDEYQLLMEQLGQTNY